MELSATTFTWMRDVGCMATSHVAASRTKGMLSLTNLGVHALLGGQSIVRLLHHYCCYRFDTPQSLQPEDGDSPGAKRHNWAIISKILKDALEYELTWERRELIVQGDIVEVIVLLKQIQDLVAKHRVHDKETMMRHRLLSEAPATVDIAARLSKPFMIGETRSPSPHPRPWLHGASKRPPAQLPPLDVHPRAPKRMKPLLPPEARLPPKALTPQPDVASPSSNAHAVASAGRRKDDGAERVRGGGGDAAHHQDAAAASTSRRRREPAAAAVPAPVVITEDDL